MPTTHETWNGYCSNADEDHDFGDEVPVPGTPIEAMQATRNSRR